MNLINQEVEKLATNMHGFKNSNVRAKERLQLLEKETESLKEADVNNKGEMGKLDQQIKEMVHLKNEIATLGEKNYIKLSYLEEVYKMMIDPESTFNQSDYGTDFEDQSENDTNKLSTRDNNETGGSSSNNLFID